MISLDIVDYQILDFCGISIRDSSFESISGKNSSLTVSTKAVFSPRTR
jgi:hypothetical protein